MSHDCTLEEMVEELEYEMEELGLFWKDSEEERRRSW